MEKETQEGMCPRCGEWTEVAWDDDGCCGAGAESEGRIYRFDDFEEPELDDETNDQLAALKKADEQIKEAKIEKYFPEEDV